MAEVVRAIGHIGEYNHQSENITSYMERLSLLLTIPWSCIKKFKEKKNISNGQNIDLTKVWRPP